MSSPLAAPQLPGWLRESLDPAWLAALDSADLADQTRLQYGHQLGRWTRWLDGRLPSDAALAEYIRGLAARGMSARYSVSISSAVLKVDPSIVGPLSAAARARHVRAARRVPPNRGQARPLLLDEARRMLALPPIHEYTRGRRPPPRAVLRHLEDRVLVALLFMAALRASEALRLVWSDISEQGWSMVVRVRGAKNSADGPDYRMLKDDFAAAVRALRAAAAPRPSDRVVASISEYASLLYRWRLLGERAGVEGLSTHSGRVGLAVELTRRGASTHQVQLAGGWRTAGTVARYAAAVAPESGAVARLL